MHMKLTWEGLKCKSGFLATSENPFGRITIEAWDLQNGNPEPPKSRPGASKIESGALEDAIFLKHLT